MSILDNETIGKLATLLGSDGTAFYVVHVDSEGRLHGLSGYDGEDYHLLKVNSEGQLEVKVSGQVPDADTVDGVHAAAFLLKAGGTMAGLLTLSGTPTVDLHASTKKYVDDTVAAGAVSGISIWLPDAPPASAHSQDDEFDDDSFDDVLWTEWDAGSFLTLTEGDQGLKLDLVSDPSAGWAGLFQDIPPGDFAMMCKIALCGEQDATAAVGLGLFEDVDANPSNSDFYAWFAGYGDDESVVKLQRWLDFDTWSATVYNEADRICQTHFYLRIRRVGSNYAFEYSSDGLGWNMAYYGTITITPKEIGIVAINNNTQSEMAAYIDFFRVVAGTTNIRTVMQGNTVQFGA